MENILNFVFWLTLLAHLSMTLVALWRVWRGKNSAARLAGLDLISTLTIAILVIISIIRQESIFVDVAIAVAALGYLSTVALSKYIADQRMA
jgi:multisubunit Na+/H+ antiporter MnhF subunit